MNPRDALPDFLDAALDHAGRAEVEAHLAHDETALREVLAQRKIERMLRSTLRSQVDRDRLRDSILTATRSEPLPQLRAQVLAETVESPGVLRWRPSALAWGSLAAAASVALLLIGTRFTRHQPPRTQPDLAAAIAATHNAIARLPAQPLPSLPAWMSPTASMLDQPNFPP